MNGLERAQLDYEGTIPDDLDRCDVCDGDGWRPIPGDDSRATECAACGGEGVIVYERDDMHLSIDVDSWLISEVVEMAEREAFPSSALLLDRHSQLNSMRGESVVTPYIHAALRSVAKEEESERVSWSDRLAAEAEFLSAAEEEEKP